MFIRKCLLVFICMAGIVASSASADLLIFSANYNTSLNAQVVPSTGVAAPTIVDKFPYGGLNMPRITTGNQGFGGGEALMTPDTGDAIFYRLDKPYPNSTYFPRAGKVSMRFKVVTTPPLDQSVLMFSFHYDDASNAYTGYSFFYVALTETVDGTQLSYRADDMYHPYDDLQGAAVIMTTDILATPGWHTLEMQWNRLAPGVLPEKADISIDIDGQLALTAQNIGIGWPAAMEDLRLGGYWNTGSNFPPLGKYGGLLDDVKIFSTPLACGDPGTVYFAGDLSGPAGLPDCKVDFYDFVKIVSNWLTCTDPADPTHCMTY